MKEMLSVAAVCSLYLEKRVALQK